METQAGLSTAEYQSLAAELGKVVVLAKVKVRRWRGHYTLKNVKVKVGTTEVEPGDRVSRPYAIVLPSTWEKAFNVIEGRLRRVVAKHAMPIKTYAPYTAKDGSTQYVETVDDDDHIIPKEFSATVRADVDKIVVGEWEPLVTKFVSEYDSIIEGYAKEYPDDYAQVSNMLPASAEAVRPAFSVRFSERPLGVSADDLTREALEKGAGDYLSTVRESIFRQAADGLKESVGHLLSRLADKTLIKKATLENVASAISVFKSVADLMPAGDLMPLLKKAENLLNDHSVKEVNQSTLHGVGDVAAQLSGALSAVATSVDAADLLEKAQRRQRKIAL
jgi:hypothetical protein